MKNLFQDFSNVNYYKFYKIRFYNEEIIPEFTIKDIKLLTDEIIWMDIKDNITKKVIDKINIQKKIIYLGEFKKNINPIDNNHIIDFYPYFSTNLYLTDFEKYSFDFCIDNPFKDDTISIKIYISEDKFGLIKEDGTKNFKIFYNSEKIEVVLQPDAYLYQIKDFYIQLEIKRRDYEYFGS